MTTDTEVLVREALHQIAPDADIDGLPPGADFRDELGLDSLDFLQLVELLSKRTGQRIDEDDYPRMTTVESAAAFLAPSARK